MLLVGIIATRQIFGNKIKVLRGGNMMILKWICFILVCLDVVSYIAYQVNEMDGAIRFIGLCIGLAARVYVLYNTATYWLLT